VSALPLFPDLLEQCDPMKRNVNYVRRGFCVWCITDFNRYHHEDLSELVCLAVIYDNEQLRVNKTGKHWLVEIKHHFYEYKMVTTGWGKSLRTERKLHYRARIREKRFGDRDAAVDFAERMVVLFDQMRKSIKGD
jgi:hypothetical protein